MRDGRGQGDQSGEPWRNVGFRSLSEIADVLIERMQKHLVANDNKPTRLVQAQAYTRDPHEDD